MVLYSLTKFDIFQPCTNNQSFRRFDLGFSQISKQIYGLLQSNEKVFSKFKDLSRAPREMVSIRQPSLAFLSI